MTETLTQSIVLLSGGMDSSTLLHHVRRTLGCEHVLSVTFHYGQKHSREMESAAWQAQAAGVLEHRQVDIGFFSGLTAGLSALTDPAVAVPRFSELRRDQLDQPPTYVPNRNMMMLSLAAAFAEARGIQDLFYAAQQQDRYGYWDCTLEFLDSINAVLALNRRKPIRVNAPFMTMRKSEIVRLGLSLGVDYAHTWTCYAGGATACGLCPSCVERAGAFEECGVPDPLANAWV